MKLSWPDSIPDLRVQEILYENLSLRSRRVLNLSYSVIHAVTISVIPSAHSLTKPAPNVDRTPKTGEKKRV
ncbi:MAG TPA: hypothetical protein VLE19_15425, partial [Pyrinomonadaceae bacterium]|nr:hypothetical protein [Pyrinomonadaceae bacterium]